VRNGVPRAAWATDPAVEVEFVQTDDDAPDDDAVEAVTRLSALRRRARHEVY
jgi:hypothetical protein